MADASHWLLVRVRGVEADSLRAHASTRRPSIEPGDLALCYAAGWKSLFAVVEVGGPFEHDPSRERWGWRMPLRPLVVLDDLGDAPPVEAAGVLPRSLGRHSYIRLTEEQFRRGRAAVAGAVVGTGFDAIADRFAAWRREIRGMTGPERADRLLALLPESPEILELGVGAGAEQSVLLARRGRLTAVDVSAEQLRRARPRLPGARLLHGEMTSLDFAAGSFDAVVSFYVFNNLPREELGPLLRRIACWLRPGGYLLAAFGARDLPSWQGDFLGAGMFFSGYEPEVNDGLVRAEGLDVVESEVETIHEPEGPGTFHWVLARRPDDR